MHAPALLSRTRVPAHPILTPHVGLWPSPFWEPPRLSHRLDGWLEANTVSPAPGKQQLRKRQPSGEFSWQPRPSDESEFFSDYLLYSRRPARSSSAPLLGIEPQANLRRRDRGTEMVWAQKQGVSSLLCGWSRDREVPSAEAAASSL